MKTTILSIFCFTIIFSVAEVPQALNYQAVARNTAGAPLQNQHIQVRLTVHDGSPTSPLAYQETDTVTTNQFGLFTVLIGNGLVTVGTFGGIAWPTGNKYLEVELDPTGGSNFTSMGTTEMVSVPYALYAQTAGAVTGAFTHYVGQLYGGGIVVSVWKDSSQVEHGIIASLSDISTSSVWSDVSTTQIGPTAESMSNGSANTAAITSQAGTTTSAALLCQSYTGGGYNNWHLPSLWELQQCYNAAMIVNKVIGDTNGFQFAAYWSSSEYTGNAAGYWSFLYGSSDGDLKSSAYSVRAVRSY